MISIVLYGRNDSYGYNLHKRAALALNCMAEILSDDDDEILFVDYNTPDDYPTFPEAIADTLTSKAAARLRILRVRPSIHERFRSRTHLKAIEPVARNVAVRRSNPRNRWILSTNTDMIFVPRGPLSLSRMVADLAPGYYHLPRFELPESLWEGFDRKDPAAVIDQVRRFGRTMFLNEIVYGADCIKYDAPGDFQLILRDDLFRLDGFDEDMLLGWHVDSNIAKRLYLVYGVVGDLVHSLFGYHCDHTRQVTPMHQHNAASNSGRVFIDDVVEPRLPRQSATWGCPGDEIEEIRLSASASTLFGQAMNAVLVGELAEPVEAWYTTRSFGETAYDPRHVLPFLADVFVSAPRSWTLAWVGGRADMFGMFCDAWRRMGFQREVLIDAWSSPLLTDPARAGVKAVSRKEIAERASVLVFDFGSPSESPGPLAGGTVSPQRLDHAVGALVRESLRELVRAERLKLREGAEARRFVCIDAVHNPYESIVKNDIETASTPFASRLRQGFVIPASAQDTWTEEPTKSVLEKVQVGASGIRTRRGIVARVGSRGFLVTGFNERLPAGDYEVKFTIRPRTAWTYVGLIRPIIIEVVADSVLLVRKRVTSLWRGVTLRFTISDECVDRNGVTEFRLLRGRFIDFVVTGITVTQVGRPTDIPERSGEERRLLDALGLAALPKVEHRLQA